MRCGQASGRWDTLNCLQKQEVGEHKSRSSVRLNRGKTASKGGNNSGVDFDAIRVRDVREVAYGRYCKTEGVQGSFARRNEGDLRR